VTGLRLAVLVGVALGSTAGCGACEPHHDAPDGAPSSTGSAPTSSVSVNPLPSALHNAKPPRLACRAIGVDGDVHVETGADAGVTPLLLQGLVPTEAWFDLAAGARLVAKDAKTTRETTFRGPGRARACVAYSEESWITAGVFESSVGAGETPGAEEWVVTPLGVVRYGAAKLQVEVHPKDAKVTALGGVAYAWLPDDTHAKMGDGGAPPHTDDGWLRVEDGVLGVAAATPVPAPLDGARAAVTRCEAMAKAAHDLTSTVMAGGADAGVVNQQVTARRLARAACATATLRVNGLPASDATGALTKSLADANAAWSSL
jgi:hypothetical protein